MISGRSRDRAASLSLLHGANMIEPRRLSHMADGVLEHQEIMNALVHALDKLPRVDKLEIDSMCKDLVKMLGWTYSDALHFLYKVGVGALEEM